MGSKYQLITELYNTTLLRVTGNHERWTGFLRAACYNYKCPFDEQILIYAQRPNATAVLELDKWNNQFDRWVNKGASGIAILDDAHGKGRLKYYFDVADTHETQRSRPVPIWEMDAAFTDRVIETLENTFGALSEKETLTEAVFSASHNAVADNLPDYLRDLKDCREDSLLEELDDLNVEVSYRKALESSIAYMLLTRLGISADAYLMPEDFTAVYDFNTPATINALGIATSDIAEMGLREVSRTVMQARREQFFANDGKTPYDTAKETNRAEDERSADNGDYLQDAGGLSDSEPTAAADAGGTSGQIRGAAPSIPDEAPQSAVHQSENQLSAGGASGGDRAERQDNGGAGRAEDGPDRGCDGGIEGKQSDALDRPDEQLPALSGGNGADGSDLRLISEEPAQAGSDENALPAFLDAHLMEAIVLDEGGRKIKRQEIFNYFQAHKDYSERCAFLENAYTDTYVEVLVDGVRVGYHKQADGLLMWEGSYLSRTSESVFSWGVMTEMTENLMERGEYKIKLGLQNAPVMAEQMTLFGMGGEQMPLFEPEVSQPPLFAPQEVPQGVIDMALYTAGNESGSAYRVAAFYMRERPERENVAFLCREFGVENGRGIEHEGRKYAIWFMEDGIHLACGNSVRTGYARTTVTWEQASVRILELLNAGTYLSPAELEQAQNKAMHDMADAIILTARDLSEEGHAQGYFPLVREIYDRLIGFPDCTKELVEQAQGEAFFNALAQEYHTFLDAYANDRSIMRWRLSDYNTHRSGVMLDGVEYPKRNFTAQPDFLRQCKMFITQDEIDHYFLSEHIDSRLDVYSHFCYPHSSEEHQKFIKRGFGELSGYGGDGYSTAKTHKGFTYEREYGRKKYDSAQLTISNVVKEYERLIAQKRFPGEDAIAHIPEYETEQLARQVYFGFTGLPSAIPHPYEDGADYYKAVPAIQAQLESPDRVQEMLNNLTGALDGMGESDRYYDSVAHAKKLLSEYADGTFSLFNHRHDGLRLQPVSELEQSVRDYDMEVTAVHDAAVAELTPEQQRTVQAMETGGFLFSPQDARPNTQEAIIFRAGEDGRPLTFATWEDAYAAIDGAELKDTPGLRERVQQVLHPPETVEPTDEQFAAENLTPGETTFEIDGRSFLVDRVNLEHGVVNFQDITFVQNAGFPIFRTEPISFVRALVEQQEQKPATEISLPPVPRKKERTDAAVPLAPDGINYRITDDALGVGAPSERYGNNVAAIRLLHEIESENRSATAEEQGVLARYVGWGGLADCFDEHNSRYAELKSLLSETKYAAARESTLTAFYTPPVVARSIYQALTGMGFAQGNILDMFMQRLIQFNYSRDFIPLAG